MKKIFLTSGIIVCMACPAFATGSGFPADATTGVVPSGQQAGACVEPKLGVYEGATTLSAIWDANYEEMELDVNIGTTAATGGAENTTYAPDLFLVGGDGVYTRSGDDDTDYEFTKVNAGGTALSTLPAGIYVNYTLHTDKPTGATGTVSGGTSTAANRAFLGFYADTDTTVNGGTPFISSDGKLTNAGNTAAADYDNDAHQWKAKYEHVHPTVVDPELYGYTFNGWATSAANATAGTVIDDFASEKIGENTHRYASWSANTYTVKYSCGTGEDITGTAPDDATATYDASFNWAGNNDTDEGTGCKKAGHHFTGWTCTVATTDTVDGTEATIITNGGVSCPANATGTGACTGTTVTKWTEANLNSGATISCTAQYSASTIAITWDVNSGTAGATLGTPTCTYGADVTLPAAPARTGYTFQGWEVSNNSGGEEL